MYCKSQSKQKFSILFHIYFAIITFYIEIFQLFEFLDKLYVLFFSYHIVHCAIVFLCAIQEKEFLNFVQQLFFVYRIFQYNALYCYFPVCFLSLSQYFIFRSLSIFFYPIFQQLFFGEQIEKCRQKCRTIRIDM